MNNKHNKKKTPPDERQEIEQQLYDAAEEKREYREMLEDPELQEDRLIEFFEMLEACDKKLED